MYYEEEPNYLAVVVGDLGGDMRYDAKIIRGNWKHFDTGNVYFVNGLISFKLYLFLVFFIVVR